MSRLETQFAAPYHAWRTGGGPEAAGQFLAAVKPVLQRALRTHVGSDKDAVLYTHARRLALEALPHYDPARASLTTHLMTHLQRLKRYAAQARQGVSVPEQVALDRHAVSGAERDLADELGRAPSTAELADRLGLSPKRIATVRQYRPAVPEGRLSRPGNDEEGHAWEPAVPQPPHHAAAEFLYADLHPVDQLILEHRLGLHGQPILPQNEIARRAGLTPGAVSQRASRIQQKLDEAMPAFG